MKYTKPFIAVLSTAILAVGIMTVMPAETKPQPASAAQYDKYDGDCTGFETAGRCADKCPDGSYLIGYKDDNGSAICKLEPTGCPYGDSIPLGPECDKHAPAVPVTLTEPAAPTNQCGGGK